MKDFKDLKSLNSGLIYSYKPGMDPRITTFTRADMEIAPRAVSCLYRRTINGWKKRIKKQLYPFYGKNTPIVEDKRTSEVVAKLKDLVSSTGREIPDIVTDFRNCFGHRVSFFRGENDSIHVEPGRIKRAHKALREGCPVEEIKKILYGI